MTTSKKLKDCSRKTKPRITGTLIALFLPFSLLAQVGESVATITPPETLAVKRGSMATQDLRVTLRPGFHVNSDKPKDEFLIPLKLTWSGPLQVQKIIYP